MVPILTSLCLAVVAVSLIGGALPMAVVLTHKRLQVYLSFAAGAMLGAAFFHMLPEAVEQGSPRELWWAVMGLLALFFLERFFAFHHHEAPLDPAEACPTHAHQHSERHGPGHAAGLVDPSSPGSGPVQKAKGTTLSWGTAAFGLTLHTLTGGVALASALEADARLGPATWGVFLATVIHKPADALTIVSLMLRGGISRARAHLVNLAFSMMVPVGALAYWAGIHHLGVEGAGFNAHCLAFSAGMFLCISLSDLLPELQFHSHDRWTLSAALLAGVAVMAAAGSAE